MARQQTVFPDKKKTTFLHNNVLEKRKCPFDAGPDINESGQSDQLIQGRLLSPFPRF